MKYVLVLQFEERDEDMRQFDAVIALEGELEQLLERDGEVDGHDAGSGEINIFVFTDDPVETFTKAKSLIDSRPSVGPFRAAYRLADGEKYCLLWPSDLREFSVT